MTEKDLPAGEYKMIIVNDPRKEKNNLKMKVSEGVITNQKMVK